MDVTGVYKPLEDSKNLTPLFQKADGTEVYKDNNTGKEITGKEAEALYGKTVSKSDFTPDQIAVMSTITGKPTA